MLNSLQMQLMLTLKNDDLVLVLFWKCMITLNNSLVCAHLHLHLSYSYCVEWYLLCDLWLYTFPWQMIILCEAQEYKVAINGFHLLSYKHRVQDLSCVDVIEIAGDIELMDVKIWWAAPAWRPFPCFLQPSIFNQPETPVTEVNLNHIQVIVWIWPKILYLVCFCGFVSL